MAQCATRWKGWCWPLDSIFLPSEDLREPQTFYLATVGSYTTAGATLIFDGQTTATTKRYKRLASYTPAAGDRVLVAKISGSYVILGKITY